MAYQFSIILHFSYYDIVLVDIINFILLFYSEHLTIPILFYIINRIFTSAELKEIIIKLDLFNNLYTYFRSF